MSGLLESALDKMEAAIAEGMAADPRGWVTIEGDGKPCGVCLAGAEIYKELEDELAQHELPKHGVNPEGLEASGLCSTEALKQLYALNAVRAGFFEDGFLWATGREPTEKEEKVLRSIEATIGRSGLSKSHDWKTPADSGGEAERTPRMLKYYRKKVLKRLKKAGM